MIRRLFTVTTVISLLLFLAAIVLYVRSRSKVDVWEARTHPGNEWEFCSNPIDWTLIHVAGWPEPAGTHHASYSFADAHDLKERSLALLAAIAPDTFVRESKFLSVSFHHGRLSTLVGSNGMVIRIPPSPPGSLIHYTSAPLAFWSISFPDWLLPAAFLLLPCAVLLGRSRAWIRGRMRSKHRLCEC